MLPDSNRAPLCLAGTQAWPACRYDNSNIKMGMVHSFDGIIQTEQNWSTQRHSVHRKAHIVWLGLEPGPARWETGE
jgi:hypothetical protein